MTAEPPSRVVPCPGMTHFLMVYDRKKGELIDEIVPFADGWEALHARFEHERIYRDEPDIEIVVLTSPSIERLRRTHARYFEGAWQLLAKLERSTAEA